MATIPQRLNQGDTIGIVTLGSPLPKEQIDSDVNFLKGMGYNVILGNYVYAANGFLAGTDEQRAQNLMSMFQNGDVKAIISTRGGVGVQGILPYLDFNIIRNNPKIISGYSDVTILLNVLNQYADLVTFQGLLLLDFNDATPQFNFDSFFYMVSQPGSPKQLTNPPGVALTSKVSGNVTGPIVGGNITSFVDCLGTPYEIDTKGKILLLEEVHESTNTIYRYINHLKVAGKLNDCIGIIMGQCSECESAYGVTYDNIIDEFIVPLGKPTITNLATAHGYYKVTIPIGATINMDAVNNVIMVVEPTVS